MAEDNWQGRSEKQICKSCRSYVVKKDTLGRCRRHAPVVGEGWPAVFETDWCDDFKLSEPNNG